MITPKQKQLVQSSFAKVVPISESAANLFYARLFALDPTLKPLFKGDMKEQGRKLMRTLAVAVNGLDSLEQIVSTVQDLGRKHVDYGVEPKHYDTVGAALLWTLEHGLSAAFTKEMGEAWEAVYTLLANTMKEAAYGAQTVAMARA
jgi:hemoglobin-like flavoprotein